MSDQIVVGTCGNCGGRVMQYTMLLMVGPFPPPKCESCGAVPKRYKPPVLDMETDMPTTRRRIQPLGWRVHYEDDATCCVK